MSHHALHPNDAAWHPRRNGNVEDYINRFGKIDAVGWTGAALRSRPKKIPTPHRRCLVGHIAG